MYFRVLKYTIHGTRYTKVLRIESGALVYRALVYGALVNTSF